MSSCITQHRRYSLNWFPPSAAYKPQWTGSALVQTMAYRLFHWIIVNWNLRNKLQWNLNRYTKIFIYEYAVCEMAAIFSRGVMSWYNCSNYAAERWMDNMNDQNWQQNHDKTKRNTIVCVPQISNISGTKSQNFNVSRLGLHLSLRNILKPSVKWRMRM